MATFSAMLHQRVQTPVTPPPRQPSPRSLHSTPSVRSYTPLSLHDYRRQQASPRTPERRDSRRLKRKPAAARLNASEHEPLHPQPHLPHLPHLPPSPPPTSHSEPTNRDPNYSFTGQRVASFRSLPALQQRPSLGLRDIARLNASSADLRPVGASQSPALPRDFGLGSRKRLPRPKDIEIRRPLTSSPIPTEPSSIDLLSTAGLATTSTLTLSKFPFPEPPRSHLTAQPTAPLNVWPRESITAHTPSLLDTPPATPAVLHFKGTSFDVVNPHNSLYLSNLETPADLEDGNDYFHRTSLDQLLPADMSPSSDVGEGAADRPQRPLFNDLQSAHASIAKAKFQASRPQDDPVHDYGEAMLASAMPSVNQPDKPARRNSLMDRARTVFKKRDSKVIAVDEQLRGMPYGAISPTYRLPITDVLASSETIVPYHSKVDPPRPSGDTWETMSDSGVPYDQASLYAETEFKSNSMYFGPINNRKSVPFGVKNQITDYSGEISYEFGDTPRHSLYTDKSRNSSVDSQEPHSLSRNIDNTLGNIYDQYGGDEPRNAAISTEELITDDEDDDAVTVTVPSLRSMVPNSPYSMGPASPRFSGLSKFDFELDPVRNSGNPESPVTSPVTPDNGVFPMARGMMRASPGKPPNSPPPLAPGELGEARPVYPHASVDYSNRASSYGDTRKLLGISDNGDGTNRMSAITEVSRLSQGDKSSQSPLQEFIERCDSQRGSLELNNYREQTQNSLLSSNTTSSDGTVGGLTFQMPEYKSTVNDIPAMWMRSASPGPAAPRNSSPVTLATDATDGDWETLGPATTRPNSFERSISTQSIALPKRSNTNPWRRDKTADNSPNVTPPSEVKGIPRFPRDSELSFLRNSRSMRASQRVSMSASNPANRPFELSAAQVKDFVAYGPSEEIVEEYEMAPLARRQTAQSLGFSNTPADRSSRVNSFDKFALVGPDANLTGTPMGTGMRYAGSSTVGSSSSPPEAFSSSPPMLSTPTRQSLAGGPNRNRNELYTPPSRRVVSSGQHGYAPPFTLYKPSPLARGSIVSSGSSRIPPMVTYGKELDSLRSASATRAERYRNMRDSSVGSSRTSTPRANGLGIPRASVRGMTTPFPLTLRNQESTDWSANRSEAETVVRPASSCHTVVPLYRHSPHLAEFPRPDSSNVDEKVAKKERLSWIIFAMFFWFAPTAILMFVGGLDTLMVQMSGGEIRHVGQKQKKWAIYAFVVEVTVLVLSLSLWLAHVF